MVLVLAVILSATQQAATIRPVGESAIVVSPGTREAAALVTALQQAGYDVNDAHNGDRALHSPSPRAAALKHVYADRAVFIVASPEQAVAEAFANGPLSADQLRLYTSCGEDHCESLTLAASCLKDAKSLGQCGDQLGDDPLGLNKMLSNWQEIAKLYPVLFVQAHEVIEQAGTIANFFSISLSSLKATLSKLLSASAAPAPDLGPRFAAARTAAATLASGKVVPADYTNVRFVKFPTWGGVGFNNMREAMTMAVYLAYALNRAVMFPVVGRIEPVLDLGRLQDMIQVVREKNIPAALRQDETKESCHLPLGWGPYQMSDVKAKYGSSTCSVLLLNQVFWTYIRFTFRVDDVAAYSRLHSTIRLHPSIMSYAQMLVDAMPETTSAVHYRVGDRVPYPLLDCEALGYTSASIRNTPCTHPSEPETAFITHEDVLLNETKPGDTIYIATNGLSEPQSQIFVKLLQRAGRKIVTYSSLKRLHSNPKQLAGASEAAARGGYAISCVEQAICILAPRFFATFDSSWDELVLDVRKWLGKPRADEQIALFDKKIEVFMTKPVRASAPDRDILPNKLVECPAGQTQSVEKCLCPLGSFCRGPLCHPGTNPKTFVIHRGYTWPCPTCQCIKVASLPNIPKYASSDTTMPGWEIAEKSCRRKHMVLSRFQTQDEYSAAVEACCTKEGGLVMCYVGLQRDVSGKWRFQDGSEAKVLPWLPGTRYRSGPNKFAAIHCMSGKLDATGGNKEQWFASCMESDEPPPPPPPPPPPRTALCVTGPSSLLTLEDSPAWSGLTVSQELGTPSQHAPTFRNLQTMLYPHLGEFDVFAVLSPEDRNCHLLKPANPTHKLHCLGADSYRASPHVENLPVWTRLKQASAKDDVLEQAFALTQCRSMIAHASLTTGLRYTYAMRVHTNSLFLKPFPPIGSLDFAVDDKPRVLTANTEACGGLSADGFAVGKKEAMDLYFERFFYLQTLPQVWNGGDSALWDVDQLIGGSLKAMLNVDLQPAPSSVAVCRSAQP